MTLLKSILIYFIVPIHLKNFIICRNTFCINQVSPRQTTSEHRKTNCMFVKYFFPARKFPIGLQSLPGFALSFEAAANIHHTQYCVQRHEPTSQLTHFQCSFWERKFRGGYRTQLFQKMLAVVLPNDPQGRCSIHPINDGGGMPAKQTEPISESQAFCTQEHSIRLGIFFALSPIRLRKLKTRHSKTCCYCANRPDRLHPTCHVCRVIAYPNTETYKYCQKRRCTEGQRPNGRNSLKSKPLPHSYLAD